MVISNKKKVVVNNPANKNGNKYTSGFPGCGSDGTSIYFNDGAKYSVNMIVSQNYSVGGAADTTSYDTSYGQRVSTAAENAQAIVTANSGKADYQKLDAYRIAICNAVTYDQDAADHSDTPIMLTEKTDAPCLGCPDSSPSDPARWSPSEGFLGFPV